MIVPKHIKKAVAVGKKVYHFTPNESVCYHKEGGQLVASPIPEDGKEYASTMKPLQGDRSWNTGDDQFIL